MESLLNDPSLRGEYTCIEDIIAPGAKELPDYKWYVMRASYCRAQKAVERITKYGALTFLPTECKSKVIKGVRHWKKVPCSPTLFFIYGTYEKVRSFTRRNNQTEEAIPYVDFTFDHTVKDCYGKDTIMTVPFLEMQNFIRMVEAAVPESYSVTPQEIHYRPGGLVRITEGPFKGVIGRVARIHTQLRVVVTIPNVLNFASNYIPRAHLEPVEEEGK